jgi:hypothetical protein
MARLVHHRAGRGMAEMCVCAWKNPTGFDQGLFQQSRRASKFVLACSGATKTINLKVHCRENVMHSAFERVSNSSRWTVRGERVYR